MDEQEELAQTVLTPVGRQGSRDAIRFGYLQLVVIGDGTFASYPLPDAGTLTIGRSPKCDVAIDHESISRRHATLTIGEALRIEDLGSANGTLVRGGRLAAGEAAAIAVGEIVALGRVNVILQQRSRPAGTRRIWTADSLRARIEDECDSSTAFAWLRIAPDGRAAVSVVAETLGVLVRERDLLGRSGAHFDVVMPETAPASAEEAVRRIERELAARGLGCGLVVACYPRDGRTVEALAARFEAEVPPPTRSGVVVAAPQMRGLHRLVAQVAPSNLGVLILGETGVGKEVFAQALHRASPRAGGPFVEINCAALTKSLLESELFGHEKGAFTHAGGAKPGLIETADRGTLLLDEIGDMPLETQATLLRVIESGQLRRVGGVNPRTVDVRFVAATNRDLEAEIERGAFRRDLFYRLNGVTLVIPPLRERREEIEPLAGAFIARAWTRDAPPPPLSSEARALLLAHAWPGNVRELKHVIERAVLLCEGGPIEPAHLALVRPRIAGTLARVPAATQGFEPDGTARPRRGTAEEQRQIVAALVRAGGNQTVAARLLGISRRTLVNRLDEYKLERPRKDRDRSGT